MSADGKYCGGYHARAIHLDYVGHAALTKRLLEADPEWSWEPLGFDDKGLPALDGNGGLWIRLTVCGVSRLGYGDAQGKSGGNAVKEAIGDALRNAGMRFGAALDLWHKGDLSEFSDAQGKPDAPADAGPQPPEGWQDFLQGIASVQGLQEYYDETAHEWFTPEVQAAFTARKLELS
ncbi:hypothetical protein [Microbacterium sp. BR1]|uniref:hypothetical protein n=1 Tax=Microbacterium sp. BR1 TaxID=1070896 RepID=UPI0018E24BD4|nr:hypothetical protein [Microbacterium sp. BR1]